MTALVLALVLAQAPAVPAPAAELVSPLGRKLYAEPDTKGAIAKADEALAADPRNASLLLAAARARDEVWRYGEAIGLYTRAIEIAPDDFRGYRHRGHRYISTRQFALAAADLERAAKLAPASFDVAYHLGLVYYLQARYAAAGVYAGCLAQTGSAKLPEGFRSCADSAADENARVAMVEWLYRALRRAGRHAEAGKLLESIREGMKVASNETYYRSLLYYKGLRTESVILEGLTGNQFSTLGYALANHHWIEGRLEQACALYRKIVEERTWSAFGYIAAETELARGACR
jgi:tetratricopeptide (TPR) repeat protein